MKPKIHPTTVPHMITANGNMDVWVVNVNGGGECIKPMGLWFGCKCIIKDKECIILFDNSSIGIIYSEDKQFINELRGNMTIGKSIIGYNNCFSDFENDMFEFDR